jgi:signal transduction histidine kinase
VTNALKHAQAKQVEIVICFGQAGVELQINDDGCGFDPTQTAPNGHFGLRGLNERARAVGTKLALDSKPGQGTRVRLTVPPNVLQEN